MSSVVYFAQRADSDIKIGWSAYLKDRLMQLYFAHGALLLLGTLPGNRQTEKALHAQFAAYCRAGTFHPIWKRCVATEWFAPADELLQFIRLQTDPPPADSRYFATERRHRVQVAQRRKRYDLAGGGQGYLPTPNKVQSLLRERFGDLSHINKRKLSEASGVNPLAVNMWLGGYVTHAELRTVEKWARFLNCPISELIEVIE